jgi:F420-0:gamma-glutamyl ligase
MLSGLKSKKLVIGVLAAVGIIVNDAMGKPVSEEAIYAALGVLGAYILSQGIADHGAQGAAKAAERAVAKGGDVAAVVQSVLAKQNSNIPVHDDDPDDGPEWEDDDGPKELLEDDE